MTRRSHNTSTNHTIGASKLLTTHDSEMAWGARSSRGIDDLVERLASGEAKLSSLCIMSMRRFGAVEAEQLVGALHAAAVADDSGGGGVLRELLCSGHDVGVEGAAALGAALVNTRVALRSLHVGSLAMGDEGVAALVAGMRGDGSEGGEAAAAGATSAVIDEQQVKLVRLFLDYKGLRATAAVSHCVNE